MSKSIISHINDFNHIISLIQNARASAYAKVNEELINLYYNVGKFVSEKVENAEWGTAVVDNLANFIKENHPEIKGFTRRGLYRMKQFYETYNSNSECHKIWYEMVIRADKNSPSEFVSALPSQFKKPEEEQTIVSAVLTQLPWSHMHFNCYPPESIRNC